MDGAGRPGLHVGQGVPRAPSPPWELADDAITDALRAIAPGATTRFTAAAPRRRRGPHRALLSPRPARSPRPASGPLPRWVLREELAQNMALAYATSPVSAGVPPGARGLPRSQVAELQRARLIAALIEVVEEDGYALLTVSKVIGRSRVSRKTFYDLFSCREDGFLAAFEQVVGGMRLLAVEAYARESSWREGIRAGLQSVLMFMDEEPGLARFCVLEPLAAGPRVLARRAEMLGELAQAVEQGRVAGAGALDPQPLTAEVIIGGLLAVLHSRLLADGQAPLADLLGPLMSAITLPYLGAGAARRELTKPCKKTSAQNGRSAPERDSDPVKGLGIRLTYRTVRVLMAIAENPACSNREVAQSAGISDEGQISKLLHRLARLDLIENFGPGHAEGAANAWHLTPRGMRFEKAARPR